MIKISFFVNNSRGVIIDRNSSAVSHLIADSHLNNIMGMIGGFDET